MAELFVGYVPVLHDGYIRIFDKHPEAQIGLLDQSVLSDFDYLRKDIRALSPQTAERMIQGLGRTTRLIGQSALQQAMEANDITMPDDDISRILLGRYPNIKPILEPIFLRWHRDNVTVNKDITPDMSLRLLEDNEIIQLLSNEAKQSSNWWRHIGAAIINNGQVVSSAHNTSMPTSYSSWIDGDPRITARRGNNIDVSIDIHAEAKLIAQCAREGRPVFGSDIYVTTFPCPNCAKLIVESGVKRCYFIEGYAMLDGYELLKSAGITMIKIETTPSTENSASLKEYPIN